MLVRVAWCSVVLGWLLLESCCRVVTSLKHNILIIKVYVWQYGWMEQAIDLLRSLQDNTLNVVFFHIFEWRGGEFYILYSIVQVTYYEVDRWIYWWGPN